MSKDLENVRIDHDEDADMEGLDKGDELIEGQEAIDLTKLDEKKDADKKDEKVVERDPKTGKFVKDADKDDKDGKDGKDGEEEEEEVEDPDGKDDKGGAKAKPDEKDDKEDKAVPYKRFREVIDQRNDLANRLKQADGALQLQNKDDNDRIKEINGKLDTLYEEVEKARADGEHKEAAKLQRQIDSANGEITLIKGAMVSRREAFQATEDQTYNAMLDTLEERIPAMDPDHEDFDPDTVKQLEMLVKGYELQRVPLTQALRMAANMLFREDVFSKKARATAKDEKTDKTEKKDEKPAKGAKKTDIAKNVDASKRNGLEVDDGKGKGGDILAINAGKLSEEDFDKLPESKLRELRGDVHA